MDKCARTRAVASGQKSRHDLRNARGAGESRRTKKENREEAEKAVIDGDSERGACAWMLKDSLLGRDARIGGVFVRGCCFSAVECGRVTQIGMQSLSASAVEDERVWSDERQLEKSPTRFGKRGAQGRRLHAD